MNSHTTTARHSSFDALDVSLELARALRKPLKTITSRDRDLSKQLRRAAASVVLNRAEGRRRRGQDRIQHWRIAAGSADEVRAALLFAEALGDIAAADTAEALALVDRVLAMLWKMTH